MDKMEEFDKIKAHPKLEDIRKKLRQGGYGFEAVAGDIQFLLNAIDRQHDVIVFIRWLLTDAEG